MQDDHHQEGSRCWYVPNTQPPQNLRPVSANTEDIDTGANASAEGGDEELEDGSETVNNIVYSFRLNQTQYDEKSYKKDLKRRWSNLTPFHLFFF